MKPEQQISKDTANHAVLRFVPRAPANLGKRTDHTQDGSPRDLSRFEYTGEADDFRRRMAANFAAFAFTVVLTVAGIWLAISIADLRKTQDCVLMGRRDCAPITLPHT